MSVHSTTDLLLVSALLQGSTRCCMTGPAFEHMVRCGDAAMVQTVMSSAAVFARMRSQQKGQVMDLLGHRGIHQQSAQAQCHIAVGLQ